MSMYTIIQRLDGKYACQGMVQDGTEYWESSTLEEAVKSMKTHAKVMNGTTIKKKNMKFFREVEKQVQLVEYVPMRVD